MVGVVTAAARSGCFTVAFSTGEDATVARQGTEHDSALGEPACTASATSALSLLFPLRARTVEEKGSGVKPLGRTIGGTDVCGSERGLFGLGLCFRRLMQGPPMGNMDAPHDQSRPRRREPESVVVREVGAFIRTLVEAAGLRALQGGCARFRRRRWHRRCRTGCGTCCWRRRRWAIPLPVTTPTIYQRRRSSGVGAASGAVERHLTPSLMQRASPSACFARRWFR
jgi:hypothetical protein